MASSDRRGNSQAGGPRHTEDAGQALQSAHFALEQVAHWNPGLRALTTVLGDRALRVAAEIDAAHARGVWRGLLQGVTVTLKDNIDVAGVPTTAASPILRDNRPRADASVVQRLERHGAIIIGKANMHEWAFGPTSQSPHFGAVVNPWNVNHIAGGSSGGSGAAVATAMCVVSIGSDTAGSIRMPAAFCGVAGLRPTVGRVSNRGSLPVSPPFDTLGPMARRVADVARVFAVIAGHDPLDPMSVDTPVGDVLVGLNEPARGLRLGLPKRYFEDLHPDVAAGMQHSIETYRRLGVKVCEIDLGDSELAQQMLTFSVVVADALERHESRLSSHPEDFGVDVAMRLRLGESVTGVRYAKSLRWMESLRHRLRLAFSKVDAILYPTTPFPAPDLAGLHFADAIRDIPRFSCLAPAAGIPALAVPMGHTCNGLPLSHELAGRWFDEAVLLRLGHAFQSATDHHLRQPMR